MDDETLIQEIAAGNREGFEELWKRYGKFVAGVVRRRLPAYCCSMGCEEDVEQETWKRVDRYAATYDPARGDVKGWLARIAINEAYRHLKEFCRWRANNSSLDTGDGRDDQDFTDDDKQPNNIPDLETISAETAFIQKELFDKFLEMLQEKLSPEDFQLFFLQAIQERSYAEIIHLLGGKHTENALRKRLYRINTRIPAWLQDNPDFAQFGEGISR